MKQILILLLITLSILSFAQDKQMLRERHEIIKNLEKAIEENREQDTRQLLEHLRILIDQPVEMEIMRSEPESEPPPDFADRWELEEYFPLTKSVLTVWHNKLQNENPKSSFVYKINYNFNIIQNPKSRVEAGKLNMIPVSVVKKIDALTPQFIEFMDNRMVCPKVMVRFYQDTKSGNDALRNRKYFRITMHDVEVAFVKNYTPEYKEFTPTDPMWYFEEVGFTASKITWEDLKTGVKYTWNSGR